MKNISSETWLGWLGSLAIAVAVTTAFAFTNFEMKDAHNKDQDLLIQRLNRMEDKIDRLFVPLNKGADSTKAEPLPKAAPPKADKPSKDEAEEAPARERAYVYADAPAHYYSPWVPQETSGVLIDASGPTEDEPYISNCRIALVNGSVINCSDSTDVGSAGGD